MEENKERLHCPKGIEDKFVLLEKSREILLEGREEIERFKEYLQFDFIAYEEQKHPYDLDIAGNYDKVVVSCHYKESVVVHFKNDRLGLFFHDFEKQAAWAMPLAVFLEPQKHYRWFWEDSAMQGLEYPLPNRGRLKKNIFNTKPETTKERTQNPDTPHHEW